MARPFAPDMQMKVSGALRAIWQLPARLMQAIFWLWQQTFSRILPPSCRFSPSCSHYGIQAISRYGLLRGTWLALWRVLRCNPWGGMGHDPVPEQFSFFPKASNERK